VERVAIPQYPDQPTFQKDPDRTTLLLEVRTIRQQSTTQKFICQQSRGNGADADYWRLRCLSQSSGPGFRIPQSGAFFQLGAFLEQALSERLDQLNDARGDVTVMSALGQKQTWRPEISMSALPPIADIAERQWDVR
jgi:hypothetical protein